MSTQSPHTECMAALPLSVTTWSNRDGEINWVHRAVASGLVIPAQKARAVKSRDLERLPTGS